MRSIRNLTYKSNILQFNRTMKPDYSTDRFYNKSRLNIHVILLRKDNGETISDVLDVVNRDTTSEAYIPEWSRDIHPSRFSWRFNLYIRIYHWPFTEKDQGSEYKLGMFTTRLLLSTIYNNYVLMLIEWAIYRIIACMMVNVFGDLLV